MNKIIGFIGRLGMFVIGFGATFQGLLSQIDGGNKLLITQIAAVPMLVWIGALVGGIMAAMGMSAGAAAISKYKTETELTSLTGASTYKTETEANSSSDRPG